MNSTPSPSSRDIYRIAIVNIDNQGSFVDPLGSLYVSGADKASIRAARFIDRYRGDITTIFSSKDKHSVLLKHIFYSMWWVDKQGNHPAEFSKITASQVLDGIWTPIYDKEWSINYVLLLREIDIWPVHCTAGTEGSEIVQVLKDAISLHSLTSGSKHVEIEKGMNHRVDQLSIFGALVEDPHDPRTWLNEDLLNEISGYDRSYWFGQEGGHCVPASMEDYVNWCEINRPKAISHMRYVEDCVSILPLGPEYEDSIKTRLKAMVAKGMVIVQSTDPLI